MKVGVRSVLQLVELDWALILYADVVLGAKRLGRKISIMGDTCDSRNIAEHAYGSTYLVHEGKPEVSRMLRFNV